MRNIIEINKDAIDSIFVELQDDDFVVLPEIGTDIVSIEIIYKAEYYFKYEEIEETLSFIAKTVIYSTDNLKPNNYGMAVKGSDLIRGL